MAKYRQKKVSQILSSEDEIIKVELDDGSKAYSYPKLTGTIQVDDNVIVNITAVDLNLGTGGWHFVLWNLSNSEVDTPRGGHIMKMRYSPLQIDCGVEEEKDEWDDINFDLSSLAVIAAPLHSQIAPISTFLKSQKSNCKIALVISDGAALPLALSDLVRQLRALGLIDSTITFGHAFGGDLECINIYTSLIAAKKQSDADFAICTMGPGIVGTNSKFGFTGVEVASHLDAAKTLGAKTYGVLRSSSADPRPRHQGISHHAITTFSTCSHQSHDLGLIIDHEISPAMKNQCQEAELYKKHQIHELNSVGIVDEMENIGLNVKSMGRSAREDELFNEMASAAAQIALKDSI